MRKCSVASVLSAAIAPVAISMFLASPASATVLLIDDYAGQPVGLHLSGGSVADVSLQTMQEGVGILGIADAHFEYLTGDPNAPQPGTTWTYNINIFDDAAHTLMSDSWNIVITGLTPTATNGSNVSLDTHFRSESSDGIRPPMLSGGTVFNITEDNLLDPPSGLPDDTYQYTGPYLSDLTTGFNSADPQDADPPDPVPEPPTLAIPAAALLGLGFLFRRRKAG